MPVTAHVQLYRTGARANQPTFKYPKEDFETEWLTGRSIEETAGLGPGDARWVLIGDAPTLGLMVWRPEKVSSTALMISSM